ncbi:MAG: type IV secretion protein IcmD [Legionellales bacterium]|nr:type IV secretion protein IcmD [Legionellales bacterium]|tara:strand:- start:941 stop:1312 length:372 start_codon:yes stop_codon:yes gene_type:complete
MIYRLIIVFSNISFAFAQTESQGLTIGDMANNLISILNPTGSIIIGGAYLAGLVIFISAVFKFKQYKDNSTQIPIGTAFALFALSVALIFLPGLYTMTGQTLFGSEPDSFGYKGSNIFGFPDN